jgi:quercetin dioxygenase-like cupin family protein
VRKPERGSRVDRCKDFRWNDSQLRAYRGEESGERASVTRQELAPPTGATPPAFATRYFELAPGAATSLERHRHPHSVVVLRGHGHVLLGRSVHAIRPFDHVYVDGETLHLFSADADAALGFLCIVDRERDRPRPASADEIEALRRDPELAAFVGRGAPEPARKTD